MTVSESNIEFDKKQMVLIIKPTEACNFSCDFCSSTELVEDKASKLKLETIFQFLKRYPKTHTIFVVGGDPLMMSPKYYFDLLEHIKENGYPTKLSLTTNLWAFYKKPERWVELLSHPDVEVGTSFQYGNGRLIRPGEVFTEEIFIDVVKKFRSLIPNKELCFLAVINDENEHLAIDHVYLAKHLDMQCRLVYASMSGLSTRPYPLSKLYKIFVKIWKLGLAEYEQTALAISDKIYGLEGACPMSRSCDHLMRSLNPDGRYFSCGPLNDDLDKKNEIDFNSEVIEGERFYLPLQNREELQFLKPECIGCKMFQVCNGCRKHTKDLKQTNMVEEHCSQMKLIMDELIDMSTSPEILKIKTQISHSFSQPLVDEVNQ